MQKCHSLSQPKKKCKVHIRLKDGKAITFLSVIDELKGYEEKKGYNRE